jgi:hypothetical protein
VQIGEASSVVIRRISQAIAEICAALRLIQLGDRAPGAPEPVLVPVRPALWGNR